MWAMSRLQNDREVAQPIHRPMNTNSSISDTPVTMSGFIMGMLVTVITVWDSSRERMRWMPTAAMVPMTVATLAESTAKIRVLRRAVMVSELEKTSPYQYSEKPEKTEVLFESRVGRTPNDCETELLPGLEGELVSAEITGVREGRLTLRQGTPPGRTGFTDRVI